MRLHLTLLIGLIALPALAQTVPFPQPRAAELDQPSAEQPVPAEPQAAPEGAAPAVLLPRKRPEPPATAPAASAPDMATPATPEPVSAPVEPEAPREYQVACPAVISGDAVAKVLPPISEGQCGLQTPLSLEAVSANGRTVPLNAPVTTDCGMATALPEWIEDVDSYVAARDNTRIASVIVGTNYACRNVDNAKTGNLSFHAFGDALDVVGFTLEDGRTVTVEQGWGGTEEQGTRIVRYAHEAACSLFTTTLGPEANALHHDHLHIDLGCHGKTCTARLCE
ncbi:MAG: extensin family protein [Devosia sp.]